VAHGPRKNALDFGDNLDQVRGLTFLVIPSRTVLQLGEDPVNTWYVLLGICLTVINGVWYGIVEFNVPLDTV